MTLKIDKLIQLLGVTTILFALIGMMASCSDPIGERINTKRTELLVSESTFFGYPYAIERTDISMFMAAFTDSYIDDDSTVIVCNYEDTDYESGVLRYQRFVYGYDRQLRLFTLHYVASDSIKDITTDSVYIINERQVLTQLYQY